MTGTRIAAALGIVAASLAPLAAQEVYKIGNGVSAPVPIRQVKADYTQEAQAQRIEGMEVQAGHEGWQGRRSAGHGADHFHSEIT